MKKPILVQETRTIDVEEFYELDSFIEHLQTYPTGSRIEFEQKYWDEGPIIAKVRWNRPENEGERKERLDKERKFREIKKERQRKVLEKEKQEYERLKVKFEGEIS